MSKKIIKTASTDYIGNMAKAAKAGNAADIFKILYQHIEGLPERRKPHAEFIKEERYLLNDLKNLRAANNLPEKIFSALKIIHPDKKTKYEDIKNAFSSPDFKDILEEIQDNYDEYIKNTKLGRDDDSSRGRDESEIASATRFQDVPDIAKRIKIEKIFMELKDGKWETIKSKEISKLIEPGILNRVFQTFGQYAGNKYICKTENGTFGSKISCDLIPQDEVEELSRTQKIAAINSSGIIIKENKNDSTFTKFKDFFSKTANYEDSDAISSKGEPNSMIKNADKVSKEYYQDAISGLDDQYAKSYYSGLKSMHDKKPNKTKADYKKLYQLHDETGPELIGSAHPKTIDVAEAMGNGGVVENQIEQQRHNIGVAKSMPSGNFQGKHAWVIHNLVKLANHADEIGDINSSDLIDDAIEELKKL